MAEFIIPILFAVLTWWFSTGIILWLIGLSPATHKWTALGATAMLIAATVLLLSLRTETGLYAAYAGFATGLCLWAWHEVMFLLGYITGPSRTCCPEGLTTTQRFWASARAVLHHEIGIAAHAVIIVYLSWGAANQYAAMTFLVLWVMRLSAKLVIFSGAPNMVDKFLPERIAYLKTYFCREAPAAIFVVAIVAVTTIAATLIWVALGHTPGSFEFAGYLLLAALTTLAVVEHWALVLPIPDPSFWEWAIKPSRQTRRDQSNNREWRD